MVDVWATALQFVIRKCYIQRKCCCCKFDIKCCWELDIEVLLWFIKSGMESPWVRGTKLCSNGHSLSIKLAAVLLYGKNSKHFFSRTKKALRHKVGMYLSSGMWALQICSNNDPRLTFEGFVARSNMFAYTFIWANCWNCLNLQS